MIHMINNKKPKKKKEPERYQIIQEEKDFHLIDSLDEEKRKLATFWGHDGFKIKGKKSVAQRMAEKVAREMNAAWDEIKGSLPPQPKSKKEERN